MALSTQHSALSTQHSALSTQHSALSTQHSALSTQHSAERPLKTTPGSADCRKGKIRGLVVAMALGLAAFAPLPTDAAFPGMNGRITFMRQDENGFLQVWVANADLSSQIQITTGAANSGWPVWAPGGSRIAFDSDRTDPDTSDSTVINDVFTSPTGPVSLS